MQLPTASIQAFHDAVDWSRADAGEQVNALARQMVLQSVAAYRRGGNGALGEDRRQRASDACRRAVRGDDRPRRGAARCAARASSLPARYPSAPLQGADSFFYWEKVDFGMKPTIRVNHAVIYRGRAQNRDYAAVAIKQLYSSHYFHTALDTSVCLDDGAAQGPHGFYLLTVKGSQQDGLTGMKGSMVRRVVVDKTRSSLERALAALKRTLEQTPRG